MYSQSTVNTAGFRISVPVECTGLPSQTKILTHV